MRESNGRGATRFTAVLLGFASIAFACGSTTAVSSELGVAPFLNQAKAAQFCTAASDAEASLETFGIEITTSDIDYEAASQSLSNLQRHLYCLDRSQLTALDTQIGSSIVDCESLHRLLNPGLLTLDILQHTGQSTTLDAMAAHVQCADSYPANRIWLDDFGTGQFVTVPTEFVDSGGLQALTEVIGEPNRLGLGLCPLLDHARLAIPGGFCTIGVNSSLCGELFLASEEASATLALVATGIDQSYVRRVDVPDQPDLIAHEFVLIRPEEFFGTPVHEFFGTDGILTSRVCGGDEENGAGGSSAGLLPGQGGCGFRTDFLELSLNQRITLCNTSVVNESFKLIANPLTSSAVLQDRSCTALDGGAREIGNDELPRWMQRFFELTDREYIAEMFGGWDERRTNVLLDSMRQFGLQVPDDVDVSGLTDAIRAGVEGIDLQEQPEGVTWAADFLPNSQGAGQITVYTDANHPSSVFQSTIHEVLHLARNFMGISDTFDLDAKAHQNIFNLIASSIQDFMTLERNRAEDSFENLIDELADGFEDDLATEEDQEEVDNPDSSEEASTPTPDGQGGCETEVERRARLLFECLDAVEPSSVPSGTGFGQLDPLVYVLDPPPRFESCGSEGSLGSESDWWTDPCDPQICDTDSLIPVGQSVVYGDGWTDPCFDPSACGNDARILVFDASLLSDEETASLIAETVDSVEALELNSNEAPVLLVGQPFSN